MTPDQKFIEACKICNKQLLLEAISEGVDVNLKDELWGTYFGEMIYHWGSCWDYYYDFEKKETAPRWSEDEILEFATIVVDNGFDLNFVMDDGMEVTDFYWHVAKWGNSFNLLRLFFQKGMDPNHLAGERSMLEELHSDIFAEECCGYPEIAKYLYDVCRFSIAYGALPSNLIRKDYGIWGEDAYNAAINLAPDYFIKLAETSQTSILGADYLLVNYGKYGYPKEFYYESCNFQSRLIQALDPIVSIIGIENLDDATLDECVEQQYDIVLKYLLDKGANPNCNCFTPTYSHIPSSALYTAYKHKDYFDKDVSDRMIEMLLGAGAKVK